MTKLCILAVALAIIARTHVAVLPGWVVPFPALILAAEMTVCVAFVAWLIHRAHLPAPAPASAGAPS